MTAKELFPYWDDARDLLIQAVERLDDDHLDWRPPELPRSIRDILWHLAETESQWQSILGGRGESQEQQSAPPMDDALPLHEILHTMEDIHRRTQRILEEMSADDVLATRVRMGTGPEFTYHWAMAQIYEHEIHHRGQIFLLMRMQGLEPPEL